MKGSTLIFGGAIIGLSLTAFSFIKWNNSSVYAEVDTVEELGKPEIDPKVINDDELKPTDFDFKVLYDNEVKPNFYYAVASRFNATITKEDLQNAKSLQDIVPKGATEGVKSFKDVIISILPEDKATKIKGKNEMLTPAQLELLQSVDYSTQFFIRGNFYQNKYGLSELEEDYLIYYMTVVPEKQASFKKGRTALMNYLRLKSAKEVAGTDVDDLKSGKIQFMITTDGTVSDVILESTSGYDSIDDKMIKLIKSMPGKWNAATDSKGEKVEQELVYSYGLIGC